MNDANENGVSEDGSSKKPTKKKRVSFKFGFETSDDAHIVKKEPNTTFDPPVSIIKNTRAIRYIMPSRLTGLTQQLKKEDNNENNKNKTQKPQTLFKNIPNIDKLNSLTFKSQWAKSKETSEENATKNEENQSDADSDDCDGSDSDGGSNHSKNDEGTTHNDDNAKGVAFQLPKRSAHSSRVIKPNKRFTDDTKLTSNKNGFGKKKGSKLEIDSEPLEAIKKDGEYKEIISIKTFFEFIIEKINLNFLTKIFIFTDDDNVLKLSDHIKNNPFAKINDDSLFGASSKSILRQSRFQFASVLQPASTITNTSIVAASNSESLFSSNLLNSNLNRNAIPCKHPAQFTTTHFQFW